MRCMQISQFCVLLWSHTHRDCWNNRWTSNEVTNVQRLNLKTENNHPTTYASYTLTLTYLLTTRQQFQNVQKKIDNIQVKIDRSGNVIIVCVLLGDLPCIVDDVSAEQYCTEKWVEIRRLKSENGNEETPCDHSNQTRKEIHTHESKIISGVEGKDRETHENGTCNTDSLKYEKSLSGSLEPVFEREARVQYFVIFEL